MIRFMCSSCGAHSIAPPGDAGQVVECKACRTPILIPDAPPAPPRKPSANEPVEIHPCPKCHAALSVLAADLGSDIACPNCQTVFTAASADGPPPPPPKKSSAGKLKTADRDEDDEDDDDRPKKRKSKRRKSSMGLRDARYRTFSPHDGVFMLVLALVAMGVNATGFCCFIGAFAGMLLSVFVVVKSSLSIREIKNGIMEPSGRVLLEVSRGLGALNVLLAIALIVFTFAMRSATQNADT